MSALGVPEQMSLSRIESTNLVHVRDAVQMERNIRMTNLQVEINNWI